MEYGKTITGLNMSQADPEVEKAVDAVCALGCEQVTVRIESLRRGDACPESPLLDPGQRAALLEELQAIMAVYGYQ